MISLNTRTLRRWTHAYVALPVGLFLVGWLKLWIGIPLAILLLLGVVHLSAGRKDDSEIVFSNGFLVAGLALVVVAWVFMSGQGGYFCQNYDHHWRNAVFHDLIDYSWPVVYPKTHTALVYYLAYWLPAAVVGKLFGWEAANAALFLWTALGIGLCTLLLIDKLKGRSAVEFFFILALFVFWSGPDLVGMWIRHFRTGGDVYDHLEWWTDWYQFSSNTTLLFFVYNQAIVPWITILLLLDEFDPGNVALLCGLTFPFAPMPFIGMLPFGFYQVFAGWKDARKRKAVGQWMSRVFSYGGAAAIGIAAVFALYFSSNSSCGGQNGVWFWSGVPFSRTVIDYLLFLALEFAALALPLCAYARKNPHYYVVCLTLPLIPLFRVGVGSDYCMRGSIPALFVLMTLAGGFLLSVFREKQWRNPLAWTLIVCLLFGAATPVVEMARGVRLARQAGKMSVVFDQFKTFSDREGDLKIDKMYNFLCPDPKEKPFFKLLARIDRAAWEHGH
jgi:hypothetical protein